MCLSCGCNKPKKSHHDARNITLIDLEGAAKAAGISAERAAENILSTTMHAIDHGDTKKSASAMATCRVIKAAEEKRFTLGVAYPALKADVNRAADGFRDFVSPEVLEKTAWEWLTKYRDVNLFHRDGTGGHFTPTESYIWRADDWVIDSPVDNKPYVVRKGDWMLGGVWDDYGWTLVKAGLVNGWSPEGGARRAKPSPERLAQLRS